MRYPCLLALAVLWFGLQAQPGVENHLAIRTELARQYARLDSALEQSRPEDALRLALPDAVIRRDGQEVRYSTAIERIRQALHAGGSIRQHTVITGLRPAPSGVCVRTRIDATVTIGGRTHSGVEKSEDIWIRTANGWRLQSSVALASSEHARSTPPATANVVVDEIGRYVRPLDDLAAIAAVIGNARVVALGEATHGTREFSAIKARLVEYLAIHRGFTVLAVEDNWAEAQAVDQYVRNGAGAPEIALRQLKNWSLRTPEMLALIRAMRSMNRATPGRMRFAGFDMTWADSAREQVVRFIRDAAPGQLAAVERLYRHVSDVGPQTSRSDVHAASEAARQVIARFDRFRGVLVAASSEVRWRHARQAAEIVYQSVAYRIEGQAPGFRDEMMARNTGWLLTEMPNSKIVIWAHNSHISADSTALVKPMGAWLREKLGSDYYGVAFMVGGGDVRAVGSNGLAEYAMPPAAAPAGEAIFGRTSSSSWFLDIVGLPLSAASRAWLEEPHRFYDVGARWNDLVPGANTSLLPLAKGFGGIVFVRQGHAAVGCP